MPTTVSELFEASSLVFGGPLDWATPVPSGKPGVYVVSISNCPQKHVGLSPKASISTALVREWMQKAPNMVLDKGLVPSPGAIASRLGEFWIPSETILYIGMTDRPLGDRVCEYYRSKLGAKSPHSGGFWIKALSNLNEFFVYYAECENPKANEDRLLETFASNVDPADRMNLRDPLLPLPFANLRSWNRKIKRHGIGKCRW